MTTGNTSCESLNTSENALAQASEYCLLNLKETRLLLLDVRWFYELYHDNDEESKSPLGYLRGFFKFESFIHCCLSEKDTSFLYDIVQPSMDDNSLSHEMETKICNLAESLYLDFHSKIADSLVHSGFLQQDAPGHDHMRLVGFIGTTALITFEEEEEESFKYPTFEEAYGQFRINKWRNAGSSAPILETVSPFICGEYLRKLNGFNENEIPF